MGPRPCGSGDPCLTPRSETRMIYGVRGNGMPMPALPFLETLVSSSHRL